MCYGYADKGVPMVVASIDIQGGKVVQLKQGADLVLQRDDVEALAREFDKYGEIAVIDLDAAMGKGDNAALIRTVLPLGECRAGGGVRTVDDAARLIDWGAKKVIVGSTAFRVDGKFGANGFGTNLAFLEALARRIGRERVVVAVDAREGEIVVDGWKTRTGLPLIETARAVAPLAGELLFTSVENEGMMSGTDIEALRALKEAVKQERDPTTLLTVAGGVSTIEEIRMVAEAGADVQLGMALYTGKVSLGEAFGESLNWKKCGGMIPVIIQEARDGQVLMTGYADREAVRETFVRGNVCLHSRTRDVLWMKGANSGQTLRLRRLRADCDRDALLAVVEASAGVCHTGAWSCFATDQGLRKEIACSLPKGDCPRSFSGDSWKPPRGYLNIRAASLTPYVPGEQPRDRAYIKLNTNENPYPPPPSVIEAVRNAASETLRLYPDPACTELRGAIAARYGVEPENVFVGNGSDEVLAFAFAAFFESGRAAHEGLPVLFPDVSYSFYPVYAALWDVPCETVPLRDDWTLDATDYLRENAGLIFPNPNAPTGLALAKIAVARIVEHQHRIGKTAIIDEAYIDFAAPGLSAVDLVKAYPNLLVVRTLSKSASLAGLRVGFALGDKALIDGLCRVRDSFNSYPVDRIAQAAALAAVRETAYYDGLARRIIQTRERVCAALAPNGWTVLPSSANFIFIKHKTRSGKEAFQRLRENGILVRHFDRPRIADYLRVTIGSDEEMDRFLEVART
ncbi:MAG: histidinol-phosphate transaminase [Spirochaetaceae bacterium]|jgi:histidinol-phosphate aminotransferase|nr:histidinol-phosphate transaminase [Spirochaetaceae bacterium]